MEIAMHASRHKLFQGIALSFIIMSCCVTGAGGQTHYSARIYALGGSAVSGIIPDYYTDLVFNPAYASLSEAFTINYGYRNSPQYEFPFFNLNRDFRFFTLETGEYRTNELLAYGIKAWGWKFALISEWYAYTNDDTKSYLDKYNSISDYRNMARTWRNNTDRSYFHGAASCSRYIGDDHIFGLRVGAFNYYNRYTNQSSEYTERYRFSDQSLETYLSNFNRQYSYNEKTQRWTSPYLQMGLLLNADTQTSSEVTLKVSRSDVYIRQEDFRLAIENYYDAFGTRTTHEYGRYDFIDDKNGDMWSLDLWIKHTFGNGFRLFAGGGYSTAAYDGDWLEDQRDYAWRDKVADFNAHQNLTGEGDLTGFTLFAKTGKTVRIERRIDVTAGIGGSVTSLLNDEKPNALLTIKTVHDNVEDEYTSLNPIRFEMERLSAQLVLPVAVEFKPARYVRIFGGFTTRVTWNRRTEKYAIPQIFSEDMQSASAAFRSSGGKRRMLGSPSEMTNAENCEENVSTSHGSTFGFSLNYGNRLFFDLYSGSDLTPDSMEYLIIDLRYRF